MEKFSKIFGKKTKIVFATAIALIVVFSSVRIFFDIRRGPSKEWLNKTFAGKVVENGGTFLKVRDKNGLEKDFLIATDTQIISGNSTLDPTSLFPEDFILLESLENLKVDKATFTVKNVRLLNFER